jgi:hypothetical protein
MLIEMVLGDMVHLRDVFEERTCKCSVNVERKSEFSGERVRVQGHI